MKEDKELYHYSIWIVMIFLCAYGLVMIYSASAGQCATSADCNFDSMYYLKKQLMFMILGIAACIIVPRLPYKLFDQYSYFVYAAGIGFILLLKTGLGISSKGATRWLAVGPVQFQVAEAVKICVIIMLASMVKHNSVELKSWKMVIRMWLVGGIPAALLLVISNDLSSAIVILGITFGISFIYTRREKMHIGFLVTVLALAGIWVASIARHLPSPEKLDGMSFRIGRIAAWINPEKYATGKGYQTLQSLYAIGRGGFTGCGLGNSIQKISAIPEAHTDMIFSIICEELGVLGVAVLFALYGFLLVMLVNVAKNQKDRFDSAVIIGIFLHIGIQTLINVAVNMNVMPNTGLPLPFISYGGTAMAFQLGEISLVLAIDRACRKNTKKE